MPGVFPDYKAPIVRNGAEGRELTTARWGMPSSSKALMDATKKRAEKLQGKGKTVDFKELLRMEPDGGTTNIRNVKAKMAQAFGAGSLKAVDEVQFYDTKGQTLFGVLGEQLKFWRDELASVLGIASMWRRNSGGGSRLAVY